MRFFFFTMVFTYSERAQENYPLADAITQAKMVLKHHHWIDKICMDKVKGLNLCAFITLERFSKPVEDLVDDTLYWEGRWM